MASQIFILFFDIIFTNWSKIPWLSPNFFSNYLTLPDWKNFSHCCFPVLVGTLNFWASVKWGQMELLNRLENRGILLTLFYIPTAKWKILNLISGGYQRTFKWPNVNKRLMVSDLKIRNNSVISLTIRRKIYIL